MARLNGNLTSDGVNLYTWNARNQLLAMTGPGVTASFSYDALGRRQSRSVNGASTQFLYDGLNPIQEAGSTGLAILLTGLGIDEYLTRTDAAGAWTLVTDALGSTVTLTDASGLVQTQYTYEPFGATAVTGPTDANAFQYTGRENDGTGLYYYRARYYSPARQRFIAEDPMEFQAGELNLYAYAMNNPLRYRDPYGLALDDWTGFLTKEEHLIRNRHNRCPWTPPTRSLQSLWTKLCLVRSRCTSGCQGASAAYVVAGKSRE
jgi:RHS repeat-associated protein